MAEPVVEGAEVVNGAEQEANDEEAKKGNVGNQQEEDATDVAPRGHYEHEAHGLEENQEGKQPDGPSEQGYEEHQRSLSRSRGEREGEREGGDAGSTRRRRSKSRSRSKDRHSRHHHNRRSKSRSKSKGRRSRSKGRRSRSRSKGKHRGHRRGTRRNEGEGYGASIRNPFAKDRHQPAPTIAKQENRPAMAVPPTGLPSDPEEAQKEAAKFILEQQVPGAAAAQQAERKAREVYVGNLAQGLVTEEMLLSMFREAVGALFPDVPQPHVRRCALEAGGKYAFVEFATKEMATVALSLKGMQLFGRPLNVNRPVGYVEPTDLQEQINKNVEEAAQRLGIHPPPHLQSHDDNGDGNPDDGADQPAQNTAATSGHE